MAVSTIKADELKSAKTLANFTQPTLSNGSHYANGCRYIKIGAFVYLYIDVKFSSTPTSNTLLFTLPSGYRPVSFSEISVSGGSNYNAKAQCTIGTNGEVRVSSVDSYVRGAGIIIHQ